MRKEKKVMEVEGEAKLVTVRETAMTRRLLLSTSRWESPLLWSQAETWEPSMMQTMKVEKTRPRGRRGLCCSRTGVQRNTKMYMADSAVVWTSPSWRTLLVLRMVCRPWR